MRLKGISITDDPPQKLERAPDDVESLLLDPSKTQEDFAGWKPKMSLYAGIADACHWYEDNPVGETFTHLRLK